MADDDEDDYLSDKFLAAAPAPAPSGTKTYSQRRQDAARRGERLQQTSRLKSRREREAEAREAGLSKTLFERAEEDAAAAGAGAGTSKALAMMLRMGFKPGQALGAADADAEDGAPPAAPPAPVQLADDGDTTPPAPGLGVAPPAVAEGARPASRKPQHRTEPLPLNEWTGEPHCAVPMMGLSRSSRRQEGHRAREARALAECGREHGEDRQTHGGRRRRHVPRPCARAVRGEARRGPARRRAADVRDSGHPGRHAGACIAHPCGPAGNLRVRRRSSMCFG
jgi:hypothetical protein